MIVVVGIGILIKYVDGIGVDERPLIGRFGR